jgi:hypothetical protein
VRQNTTNLEKEKFAVARKKQVEMLRSGVEVWNGWRGKNPEVIPDLSGADLRADLSGADLRCADLSEANLCNVDSRSPKVR